jgi:hypothetical protein
MSTQLKFSDQETKVINFLTSRNGGNVFWEELAQFAKDPQTVKLKTIKKTVSEIKRKYSSSGLSVPFSVTFHTMSPESDGPKPVDEEPAEMTINAMEMDNLLSAAPAPSKPQVLVQVKRTPADSVVAVPPSSNPPSNPVAPAPAVHADFVIERNYKRIRTKFGSHNLNDSEWEVFKYFHANAGKLVPISELRDKVVYPQYGSKLPARWFDAIMRIVNNMRRAVPGLERRLLTVKGPETTYLFQ